MGDLGVAPARGTGDSPRATARCTAHEPVGCDPEASQRRWREAWRRDPPFGDVGTRLLWENDGVRVWHLELAPGESSPLHTHMHPYFFVVVQSSRTLTEFADGSLSEDEDPAGAAVWAGLEGDHRTHVLTNVGDEVYVNRVIELLGS